MASLHEMIVVSGPNGSGKTTMAKSYAERLDYPYIGADDIAAAIAPDDPASQRMNAGRRFSAEIATAIQRRQSVVIESTLSGRTFAKTIQAARDVGFTIEIVHLFLDSAETCVARVAERVQKGGHDVPEQDIRRRFARSSANFWRLYRPLVDRWILMYNSTGDAQPVAEGDRVTHSVQDNQLFNAFIQIIQTHD